MHGSTVVDIRSSFGAAFVGLLVSTVSVLPWARPPWYSSELLNF